MNLVAKILGPLALLFTLLPPLLFLGKAMEESTMKACLLMGTVAWFAVAPWFLKGGSH